MPEQWVLYELIPLILSVLAGIVGGIITFFKLYRHWGRSLSRCILAVVCSVLAAIVAFFIAATLIVAVRGRWCEGCQEYH